jgi:hypothetical protein
MSTRVRLAVLTTAALIAAGYTASLAIEPLCSVFRSPRHYAGHASTHSSTPTASTPATLADHP